ncbi:Uncharacterised protein [Bacteroides intestinalis]|uniref:PNPLA domain-containing protein n=2 Tax=Bacteroides intestinalis TaxID=329854 RepID=A0A6N2VI32_9BACE
MDCYWHKDREISETKAIFEAFYQIIMEKKIHINPKTGLVLEGGGMRGVFTCGVLDSFMDRGIRFPYTIGVSAGACNGLSYMSGQRGRAKYSNIDLLEKYQYIGLKYLLKKRNIMDFDLLFQEFPEHILPYDYESYFSSPERYEMVTTNCVTGEANYFEEKQDKKRVIDIVRASSSLPFVCPIAYVDDVPMLDGGIVDSIPLMRARNEGFTHNVVVLTRNRGYRKEAKDIHIPSFFYRKYPKMREALSCRCRVYNEQLEMVERMEEAGEITVIRPQKPVMVDRIERDIQKLTDLYEEGYACAAKYDFQ